MRRGLSCKKGEGRWRDSWGQQRDAAEKGIYRPSGSDHKKNINISRKKENDGRTRQNEARRAARGIQRRNRRHGEAASYDDEERGRMERDFRSQQGGTMT